MEMIQSNQNSTPNVDTVALYQQIYKNAQTGMGSLGKLLCYSDIQGELRGVLEGQRKGYTAILRKSANALAMLGIRPVGMRAGEKLHVCAMIAASTMKKPVENPEIIGLVITGITRGSIEGAKKKSRCVKANDDSKALMERLLRFEEASCRVLRSIL